MTGKSTEDFRDMLAHHDAAIGALGGRMTGMERNFTSLQGEVHQGFNSLSTTLAGLNSKIDSFGSRPQFDFHRTVSTVLSLAVLFSMTVAGIVYVTQGQFSGMIAEQKGFNTQTSERFAEIKEKLDWLARVEPAQRSAQK